MVGKFIELDNGKVIIKPACFHNKPLKDIIDFYPDSYEKVIYFLHCMISLNPLDNPYADIPEQDKEEHIMRYLGIDVDTDNDIIKDGLECVLKCYATPIYGSYKALKSLRDKINKKLEDVEIDFEKDGNSGNVTAMVKSLSTFNKELKEAKKDYLEEQGEVRGRGGVEMAYDESDEEDDLDLDLDDDLEDDD